MQLQRTGPLPFVAGLPTSLPGLSPTALLPEATLDALAASPPVFTSLQLHRLLDQVCLGSSLMNACCRCCRDSAHWYKYSSAVTDTQLHGWHAHSWYAGYLLLLEQTCVTAGVDLLHVQHMCLGSKHGPWEHAYPCACTDSHFTSPVPCADKVSSAGAAAARQAGSRPECSCFAPAGQQVR